MTTENTPPPDSANLVVVGASAGGIEAMSVLVSTLPARFPAPLVLAQHLDPRRRSNLEQILQRRSPLPVVVVQDGPPTRLQPGTIYVVPANRHVTIIDSKVGLAGDHGDRPRPSIDLLLNTASQAYGENLIAVILTGSGSDGASGAVAVSQAGGTVVIQNPETAQFPAMPLALPPTAVDHIADLERIGPLLYELLSGTAEGALPEAAPDPLRDILAHITRQANLDFRNYKPTTILRRIGRRMSVTHTRTLADYLTYLDRHPEEVGELVMAFLIKVTEFFRDPAAFDYLRTHILPAAIEHGRTNGQNLRLWSAGCATGEEPYSLAVLLADALGTELSEWTVKIFATDLDEQAINFARRGLYPANVLANLPDDYRQRFFDPVDQGYRVSKLLRQMVIFGEQDLSRGVPFPRMDLVVCRNVLIYFKPELQQSVLDTFAYSLHETHGFLFLGQAETVRPVKAVFDLVNKKWKVYRCTQGPLVPRAYQQQASELLLLPTDRRPRPARPVEAARGNAPGEPAPPVVDMGQLRRFNESVLRLLPSGVAVIDRSYHTVTINPAARRLLNIREMSGEHDFLHSARGLSYNQVRSAIDTVFRDHAPAVLPDLPLTAITGGPTRFLTLTIVPMQLDAGTPDLAVINIHDTTDEIQTRQSLEAIQIEQKQLVEELSEANRRLNDLNKELQDANEELQASNEEMMLTQEELQATNEEFEATNEELQATNEELETNNEELQATNEELETTNEELGARTTELQELTQTLTDERRRLSEMIELAPFYMMVVRGPALLIEGVNPRYARLLEGQGVIGRPLEEVSGTVELGEIVHQVRDAYQQNAARTTPARRVLLPGTGDQRVTRYFVYTIVPMHDGTGNVDGAVIYADDISEQMVREAEQRRQQFKLLVEQAGPVAIGLYDAETHELLQASPRYLEVLARLYGRDGSSLIGEQWDAMPPLASGADATLFDAVLASQSAHRLSAIRLPGLAPDVVWDLSLIPITGGDSDAAQQVEFIVVSAVELPRDDGRRTMDDGQWTTDDGRRTTGDGRRAMDDGRRTESG